MTSDLRLGGGKATGGRVRGRGRGRMRVSNDVKIPEKKVGCLFIETLRTSVPSNPFH